MNVAWQPTSYWFIITWLPHSLGIGCVPGFTNPVILNLLILAAGSVFGLACVWAGLSRSHWFLRVAAIQMMISLPLAIPAYELVVWFFTQSVVTIPPLLLLRAIRARRRSSDGAAEAEDPRPVCRWPQWSVRDQLLSFVLVAGILAVAVRIPSEVWWYWSSLIQIGILFGISTLAGTWACLGTGRPWRRFALVCLFPLGLPVACWLGLFRVCRRQTRSAPGRPATRRLAGVVMATYSLLLLVPPAAVFCRLVYRVPIPPSPELPDPNGYDDLVRAGKMAINSFDELILARKVTYKYDVETATEAELRAVTTRYTEALAAARLGLDRRCQIPMVYGDFNMLPRRMEDRTPLRVLQSAFREEGELAEREDRTADAARSYLDIIRLGYSVSRGGLETDSLLGRVIRNSGVESLREICARLTSSQCTEFARTVDQFEKHVEAIEDVLARERAWEDHAGVWQIRVPAGGPDLERIHRVRYRLHRAKMRLVICELALRAYYLDHNVWPARLADLTPRYLTELPASPFTGEPISYRRTAQGYRLYCVPPNLADDEYHWKELLLDFNHDRMDR